METLWKSVVELSGKSRLLNSLLPTAIFLTGLGALYVDAQSGWQNLFQWWQTLAINTQLILVVASLLFVVAVAAPFDVFTPTFLRWAEGYWSDNRLLRWLYERRAAHHRRNVEQSQRQFGEIRDKQDRGMLSRQEEHSVQQLDELLHYYPPDPQRIMPTFLGNVIRAAEEYSRNRYGLDPIVTWVRLFPSISSTLQDALEGNLTTLNLSVRLIVQITFFAIIGVSFELVEGKWFMGLLVLVTGWIIARLSYQAAIQSAKSYSELIRSAFDLHRFDLYTSLHLPLPIKNGDKEQKSGDILTRFLWRGDVDIQYKHTEKK